MSLGFFPDAFPRLEISHYPSFHRETKFSTSIIIHSSPSLEAWYKNRRILRLSSHFSFRSLCISFNIRSQCQRGGCQILWIVEESRGSCFSSRQSFKNVSWSTHYIQCIVRQSRLAARHASGTRKSGGWTGMIQSCSLFQDRKILSHLTRNLFCSVNPKFESIIDSQS